MVRQCRHSQRQIRIGRGSLEMRVKTEVRAASYSADEEEES